MSGCHRGPVASATQSYDNARLQLQRGDLSAVLGTADRGLKEFPDPATEWHWKFTTLKAEALLRKRSNQQALDLLSPALPESLATSDVAVWRQLTEGSASAYLYEFQNATRFLANAQTLASQYHPELLGEVALRKGTLDLLQNDAEGAQSSYRAALQIARQRNDPFLEVASLGSLGLISTQQEHYDASLELNRTALQLSQSVGAEGSTTNILGNMAWGLFELGDYEGSLNLFEQAERSAANQGSPASQLIWAIDVGELHAYLRDYPAAETDLRQALDLAGKLNQPSQIVSSLAGLAAVSLSEGRLDAADSYGRRALTQSRAIHDRVNEISAELIEARIESEKQNRVRAEQILTTLMNDPAAGPSVRWEAQAGLATVYSEGGESAQAEKEFRSAIATVETARASVQQEELRLSFLSNAIDFYDDYVEFLVAQHRTGQALGIASLPRAQTLVEGLGLSASASNLASIDWSHAAKQNHAIILCYWLGRRHSYLWAIQPAGPTRLFTLPAADQIDSLVRSYSEALLGPRDPLSTNNPDGHQLYTLLVQPAAGLIPRGSRVVIVPDGTLFALNFEALPVGSPTPHYWIDDVSVINASSPIFLAAKQSSNPSPRGKLLLIGDPVSPSADFPALPQAGAEIADIEKHFSSQQTTVITGGQATPQAYMASQPARFSYIHFVAHGTSSEATPLESAVILSRQGDAYKLYGRDIVKYSLNGALVTISACHGAGSRTYSGEGLVGLSWAFLRAGARAVIAALWEVDDASTAQLMDRFYDRLGKGDDPASALRDAKLSLLHSNTVYQKPFYWAAFQYYTGK
jgi:CHAT domain-containing protein